MVQGGGGRPPTSPPGAGSTAARPSSVDPALVGALGARASPRLRHARASPGAQSRVGGPGKPKGADARPWGCGVQGRGAPRGGGEEEREARGAGLGEVRRARKACPERGSADAGRPRGERYLESNFWPSGNVPT